MRNHVGQNVRHVRVQASHQRLRGLHEPHRVVVALRKPVVRVAERLVRNAERGGDLLVAFLPDAHVFAQVVWKLPPRLVRRLPQRRPNSALRAAFGQDERAHAAPPRFAARGDQRVALRVCGDDDHDAGIGVAVDLRRRGAQEQDQRRKPHPRRALRVCVPALLASGRRTPCAPAAQGVRAQARLGGPGARVLCDAAPPHATRAAEQRRATPRAGYGRRVAPRRAPQPQPPHAQRRGRALLPLRTAAGLLRCARRLQVPSRCLCAALPSPCLLLWPVAFAAHVSKGLTRGIPAALQRGVRARSVLRSRITSGRPPRAAAGARRPSPRRWFA